LGQAKSLYHEPDTGGSAAFHASTASPESAARLAGIPIIKLPDLGIVRDRFDNLIPAGNGDLKKLRQGSEAQPFLDPREHVVYKVYSQNDRGGLGRRLAFTREGERSWHVGHFDAGMTHGLEKLQWIQEIGGLPTEIQGITPRGEWVAKQPEATPIAPHELQRALEQAWKAAGMVKVDAPDMDHVRVIWHRGEPWMMGDFSRGNIMRDVRGTPRFMDGNVGRIPEAMIKEMPAVAKAVEEARRLAVKTRTSIGDGKNQRGLDAAPLQLRRSRLKGRAVLNHLPDHASASEQECEALLRHAVAVYQNLYPALWRRFHRGSTSGRSGLETQFRDEGPDSCVGKLSPEIEWMLHAIDQCMHAWHQPVMKPCSAFNEIKRAA
jgi:hypothetical protein